MNVVNGFMIVLSICLLVAIRSCTTDRNKHLTGMHYVRTLDQNENANNTAVCALFDDYEPLCHFKSNHKYCTCNTSQDTSFSSDSSELFLEEAHSLFAWKLIVSNKMDVKPKHYFLTPLIPDPVKENDPPNYRTLNITNNYKKSVFNHCLDERMEMMLSHCISMTADYEMHSAKENYFSIFDNFTALVDYFNSMCGDQKKGNDYYICRCIMKGITSKRKHEEHEFNQHLPCDLINVNNLVPNKIVITFETIKIINITQNTEVFVIAANQRNHPNCSDIAFKHVHLMNDFLSDPVTLQITDFIFSIVSLLSLLMTIFVFATCPELRNLHGKNLLSLSVTLFFSQIMFLKDIQVNDDHLCNVIGCFLHYCWLSVFFWTSIMAYDLAKTFRQKSSINLRQIRQYVHKKQYRKYALMAWGIPVIVVTICLLLNINDLESVYGGHFNAGVCMITYPTALFGLFVPFGFGTLFNVSCFIVIVHGIENKKVKTQKYRLSYEKTRCYIYIKLSALLGMSWIICLIATLKSSRDLWFTFSLTNNVHSLSIFFAFFLMNRRVRQILKKRLKKDSSNQRLPVPIIDKTFKDLCQINDSLETQNETKSEETENKTQNKTINREN